MTPVHWRRLEKVFLSIGFVFVRQEESHRAYSRAASPRPIVIPAYDEVPVAFINTSSPSYVESSGGGLDDPGKGGHRA